MRRKGSIKAPKMRRQEGDSAGAGAMPEIGRKNRRLPIAVPELDLRRRSSRKPPEESSAASVSPVAQTPSTPPVADTPPLVETVESPTKIPAASVSPVAQTPPKPPVADTPPLVETVESPAKVPAASVSPVAQTPPKPPFADTPPPLTTMQMVESSAESNLPQEEYKEIMLDGTSSVVAKPYHAAANTPAMQQVETAGKRDGA